MSASDGASTMAEQTAPEVRVPPVRVVFDESDRAVIAREIDEVLASGMVAAGPKVASFEEFWADYTGCDHAIACSSGGAALEILMKALDVRGKDVLIPTNTFIATVNAVIFAGGNPVLLDLDPSTMCVNLAEIERRATENTAGVIVVHIGGIMSPEMESISAWCRSRGVWLVEDAAHAHGSEVGGKRAGSFGIAGAYSFFATKVMTSCEGGMIVCEDEGLAELCRGLRDYGKRSQWESVHSHLSSNYRLSEISAVIGLSQSRRLDEFIAHRADAAAEYTRQLEGRVELVLPVDRSSWYKYIAVLPDGHSQASVKKKMKARGVSLSGGVYEMPVHLQPVFTDVDPAESFPLAEDYCVRHVCLPLFFGITDVQVQHVVSTFLDVLNP